jgi:Leucine-rich repeat (LRR) protein
LVNLKSLNLSQNKLVKLPKEINHITNLENLFFSNNPDLKNKEDFVQ